MRTLSIFVLGGGGGGGGVGSSLHHLLSCFDMYMFYIYSCCLHMFMLMSMFVLDMFRLGYAHTFTFFSSRFMGRMS